jgi:two-component system sensor histidine kinase KdpD
VFTNLIENAVKFSPPDEPVRVQGAGAPRVIVRVTDAGSGIPPAQRGQVFDPFFRGRDGTPGSGLGLAICKGFVEANGARIQVQTHSGRGTTFLVSFPRIPQPTQLA